jgi:hypothetical protein
MMIDAEYIHLSNLFSSLGIIEKGIEKIYHHLLEHKRIENLKDVCDKYSLSLKRGYKICSVLSDLGLVQIYDRPMKINLTTPLVPTWQKLTTRRIEELKYEFKDEKKRCSESLDDFIKKYNLKSLEAPQEPVELLLFDIKNVDELYYPLLTRNECKIAIGIRYENPLVSFIKNNSIQKIEERLTFSIIEGMNKIKENLKHIDIQVIFNNKLIEVLLSSKEFSILYNQIDPIEFEFKRLDVHITDEKFSNFSLTDDELVQPSFDPTNKLMGSYISRNDSIYQIFNVKFIEIFDKGMPLNEFVSEISTDSLSEKQKFALCLL